MTMVGIDVSKDTLSCALLHDKTHALLWEGIVPNTADGIREVLHKTPADSAFVVEPTGKYSSLVVKQSVESGRRVLLAAPKKAKRFLQSIQSRAKTDKLDSRGLALYALSQPLPLYPIKSPHLEQIDELLAARRGISSSLSRLKQQCDALPHAKEVLSPAIAALKQQKDALDKEIAQVAPKSNIAEAVARLRNVPGIGPVTATAVASCLSSKNFSHPDKFVAYIGLDISIVQSGRRQGERGLTHQGDPELRRLLYLCAQSNLSSPESPFKTQYERERAKGLSTTAALVAVARKLAKVCWSLHHHQSEYNPDHLYQQRPRHNTAENTTENTTGASAAPAPEPTEPAIQEPAIQEPAIQEPAIQEPPQRNAPSLQDVPSLQDISNEPTPKKSRKQRNQGVSTSSTENPSHEPQDTLTSKGKTTAIQKV